MNNLDRLAAGIAGACLALLLAVPALAHADLASSTPKDGATLDTPPITIELTFTEGLVRDKSSIRLAGPDGEVGTAAPEKDGAKVIRLVGLALAPGAYTVKWTAAADDGHVERGTVRFTVTGAPPSSIPSEVPATETPASATPAAPPTDAPATAVAATQVPAASAPTDPQPAAGSGTDVVLPVVAALALVGIVGFFVLRRSRGA